MPLHLPDVPEVTRKTFAPYGCCTYCGTRATSLSREHIIPYALNGLFVLPDASCRSCAAKTSEFERQVLRGPMWPVRAHLQLKSRRAHLAPRTAPLLITRHGQESRLDVPLRDHPLLLTFPVFAPPSFVTGNRVHGINVRGQFTFGFGKPYADVVRELQADNVRYSADYNLVPFAQMIGKIAWAMAAANGDLQSIRDARLMVSALIHDPNEIGQWVGTFTDSTPDQKVPGRLHSVVIRADLERGLLIAEVQLFADSGAPRYAVVLGRLRWSVLLRERLKRWLTGLRERARLNKAASM